jgi:hypothetical protein
MILSPLWNSVSRTILYINLESAVDTAKSAGGRLQRRQQPAPEKTGSSLFRLGHLAETASIHNRNIKNSSILFLSLATFMDTNGIHKKTGL